MAHDAVTALVRATDEEIAPLVLTVGKKKKRVIKDLKRGQGGLMYEVERTLDDVRGSLGAKVEGKELVPVVMIYRQKSKRKRRGLRWF